MAVKVLTTLVIIGNHKKFSIYTKDLRKDGSTPLVSAFMTMFISKLAKSSEKT